MARNRLLRLKNILLLLGSLAFCFVLAELGLALMVKTGRLPIEVPTYSWEAVSSMTEHFHVNSKPWGNWHLPNRVFRHKTACYDVVYRTNSVGARDKERPLQADQPRVVVLGDSMTMGPGAPYGTRFTERLEKKTGLPHLNFGVAAVGPNSEYVLYRRLASRFEHDAVIVALFPGNDFLDMSYQRALDDNYVTRPYFVGQAPDYELVMPDNPELDSETSRRFHFVKGFSLERFLKNFTYTYNAFAYMEAYLREMSKDEAQPVQTAEQAAPFSFYYEFSDEDWSLLRHTLIKIRQAAEGKKMLVCTLGVMSDFAAYEASDLETPPLVRRLQELSREQGFEYVDALTAMYAMHPQYEDFSMVCDGHFSSLGHECAARALSRSAIYDALGADGQGSAQ
ncbi:MAG: GDSL-type esterase/lipase family protein [Desulfovibrionaceae bacterium]